MPDSKITALTSISTSTDPANDPLVIVDVSDTSMAATGTTKKVTLNQLLGASGTATLASATISGDLTVDTSTLKVDSANNRVGIGTASPIVGSSLDVRGAVGTGIEIQSLSVIDTSPLAINNGGGLSFGYVFQSPSTVIGRAGSIKTIKENATDGNYASAMVFGVTANGAATTERYRIASDGVATWSNVGGVAGTAMTLNSTGLGVGVSPAYKLSVAGTANIGTVGTAGRSLLIASSAADNITIEQTNNGSGNHTFDIKTPGWTTDSFNVYSGSTLRFKITGDGNVGIGVTPSAWSNSGNIDLANGFIGISSSGTYGGAIANNAYYNAGWKYKAANYANLYLTGAGEHKWLNAPVGAAAGNAITFTQAMTLDASGNLLVGTTGLNGSWNTKLTLSNDSGTTKWAVGPYLGGVTNFLISAGASTGVYLNGTAATSWTSASDERLKDIIEPISNAASKVASLRAVIGKFKFDENNTRKPFLIAQDIQAVLPEAVDASNPDRLGVAYTDVIPLLVAAIKELTTRVQTLEAR